jgi:hypothetical protein
VHEGLRAFRDEMTEFRGETRMRLDRHGELLEEILQRLPSGPSNGPAGGRNDH